jgi:branched-chain amino acid transport system ATP-binding protein
MNNILDVSGVSVRFGGLTALDDVGFSVPQGAVTALIGPNGAGKTTCFNVLSGLQRSSGVVAFKGKDISAVPAHHRVGLGRTFQIVQLFGGMTVEQSVMVGCQRRGKGTLLSIGLALPGVGRAEAEIAERTRDILQRLGLWRVKDRLASDLPLGQQRLVELARALASEPTPFDAGRGGVGVEPR